jgi:hypothetical protein
VEATTASHGANVTNNTSFGDLTAHRQRRRSIICPQVAKLRWVMRQITTNSLISLYQRPDLQTRRRQQPTLNPTSVPLHQRSLSAGSCSRLQASESGHLRDPRSWCGEPTSCLHPKKQASSICRLNSRKVTPVQAAETETLISFTMLNPEDSIHTIVQRISGPFPSTRRADSSPEELFVASRCAKRPRTRGPATRWLSNAENNQGAPPPPLRKGSCRQPYLPGRQSR